MKNNQIKMGNTAFSAVFVQSFDSEEDFVKMNEEQSFRSKDIGTRRKILKDVYRIGKKMKAASKPPNKPASDKGQAQKTVKTASKKQKS